MLTSLFNQDILYLFLALALGSIVGLENEYRKSKGVRIFLGLRTSIFVALLGYLFGFLFITLNNLLILITGFGVISVIASLMYVEKTNIFKSPTATTFVSTLILFIIGVLTAMGIYLYAIIVTVLVAALSFYKIEMEEFVANITRTELIATLNLLIIALVVLPILPNYPIGPYDIFNPFQFWEIVVIVAVIFFIQYFASKLIRSGFFLSSLVGGIVSGTTIILIILRLSNQLKQKTKALILNGLFSSNFMMIITQIIFVFFLVTYSVTTLVYFLPVTITFFILMMFPLIKYKKNVSEEIKIKRNPLPLLPIFEFALILFVVMMAADIAIKTIPQLLPATIFIASFANVIAASLTVGLLLTSHHITAAYAALLLGLELIAAVLEKGIIGLLSKNKPFRRAMFIYSTIFSVILSAVAYTSFAYGI
ncbi:MAG: DUF4010 domain-containing protein [Candidatus Parvarchaeota archaeon]|nr:DUF4010 domain-containing protein [Candidatus Parvarchaeota archaeon]